MSSASTIASYIVHIACAVFFLFTLDAINISGCGVRETNVNEFVS